MKSMLPCTESPPAKYRRAYVQVVGLNGAQLRTTQTANATPVSLPQRAAGTRHAVPPRRTQR